METQPYASRWSAMAPDLRAAIYVALPVIVLEVASDAIPLAGWLVGLPFAVGVYLAQGILVGVFLRRDARYTAPRAWHFLGIGARSALWTGVLSLAVSLLTLAALASATLGAILVGLPALAGTFLADVAVNAVFSALGAWVYSVGGAKGAAGFSCVLAGLLFVLFWLALAVGVVWLIVYGVGHIPPVQLPAIPLPKIQWPF
jgi:hypothetical protein